MAEEISLTPQTAQGTPEKAQGTPERASGPLHVVYSSYSPIEAHIVSGMLEDNGIGCFLSNEFIANANQPLSNVTGGVQVKVQESDVERASELLREPSSPEAEPPAV